MGLGKEDEKMVRGGEVEKVVMDLTKTCSIP